MNQSPEHSQRRLSRRHVLAFFVTSVSVILAGCEDGSGNVKYHDRTDVDLSTTVGANASNASAASAVTARAERESDNYAIKLDSLKLRDHKMGVRDDYRGAVIQENVENTGHQRVELVEVHARIYNTDGEQLGRYLDSTHDVAAGSTWDFDIIALEKP